MTTPGNTILLWLEPKCHKSLRGHVATIRSPKAGVTLPLVMLGMMAHVLPTMTKRVSGICCNTSICCNCQMPLSMTILVICRRTWRNDLHFITPLRVAIFTFDVSSVQCLFSLISIHSFTPCFLILFMLPVKWYWLLCNTASSFYPNLLRLLVLTLLWWCILKHSHTQQHCYDFTFIRVVQLLSHGKHTATTFGSTIVRVMHCQALTHTATLLRLDLHLSCAVALSGKKHS